MPTENDPCPKCGETLKDRIDYVRGHKTASGRECPNCSYEEEW